MSDITMMLVGSRAMAHYLDRDVESSDYDLICHNSAYERWFKSNYDRIAESHPNRSCTKYRCRIANTWMEFEICDWIRSSECLYLETMTGGSKSDRFIGAHQRLSHVVGLSQFNVIVPPQAVLAAIKRSHLHIPLLKWRRHMVDYHQLVGQYHALIEQEMAKAWYIYRVEEADNRHKFKSKPKLTMSNDEFFGKSESTVGRIYDHDDLHRALQFYDEPLYQKLKHDRTMAKCERELFAGLSVTQQTNAVLEEAFVIALERRYIPVMSGYAPGIVGDGRRPDRPGMADELEAARRIGDLEWALMRICTTLTSGWFRDFAIDNWPSILSMGSLVDYVEKFLAAVAAGSLTRRVDSDV